MKITKVRFYEIDDSGSSNFLAKCSIVLEDSIILHEVKILNGRKGRYIIMPKKFKLHCDSSADMNADGEDVFHPVSHDYFRYMSKAVLDGFSEYERTGSVVYRPE